MIWLILLPFVLGLVIWKLLTREVDPLDKVPGPKQFPIVGNSFQFFNVETHDIFEMLRKFNKEYGDRFVVRVFSRRILHVNNPADAEIILTNTKNISKNLIYKFMEPWLGTGLLLSTGSKWHKRRKLLTPTFHFNILKNFATVMEENSRIMVKKLEKTNGGTVELLPLISDMTLFTLCETAMGTELNSDSTDYLQYKNSIKNISHDLISRLTRVWLHLDFLFTRSSLGKSFQKHLDIVHSFADKVILERKNQMPDGTSEEVEEFGIKKRKAMLDLLLEDERKGDIDLEGIREEVNTFMFAGHDTTAIALTFLFMLLADHEDVQERVYEECQSIFGDSDRPATMADFGEMKYIEAVIKESLRLYPSAPSIARTITEDFYLGDLKVKKGSEVVVHIFDIHRRPDLYEEPERFNPDRFLNPQLRHPYAFVPFSAGSRNCIGQRFAMLEMKSVINEVIRAFKLTPVKKGARPRLQAEITLKPLDPVMVNFVPRNKKI